MTEASYQRARKLMQQLNYLRGNITAAKKNVAGWTHAEMVHLNNLEPSKAANAHRMLLAAMDKLNNYKAMFAAIQFPPADLPPEMATAKLCRVCHDPINNDQEYCLTCYENQNIPK